MGIEENKDTVRRMVSECVNTHRAELLEEFVHPGLRVHPGTPGTAPDSEGLDGLRAAFERFRTTFPDLHVLPGPPPRPGGSRRRGRPGCSTVDRHRYALRGAGRHRAHRSRCP